MFRDAWRIERAFFYNPNYDGLNIDKAEKEFAALPAGHRQPRRFDPFCFKK